MSRALLLLLTAFLFAVPTPGAASAFPLQRSDVVVFIGGGDMAAAQHSGHLESLLAAKFPETRFRNLAWEGDTVFRQARDFNFPSLKETVKAAGPTVLVMNFGRIEALGPHADLSAFESAYRKLLGEFLTVTPRIALVIPPPYEKPIGGDIDLSRKNPTLQKFCETIRKIALDRALQVIDLQKQLSNTQGALTSDGLQLTPIGQALVARAFAREIGASDVADRAVGMTPDGRWTFPEWEELRQATLAKSRLWFNYSRPQNWAFLGGDRTEQPSSRDHRDPKIRWFPEEMKQYPSLIAEAEKKMEVAARAVR